MHGKRNMYHRDCALKDIDYNMLVKQNQECGFDSMTSRALGEMLHDEFTAVDQWCQDWSSIHSAPLTGRVKRKMHKTLVSAFLEH